MTLAHLANPALSEEEIAVLRDEDLSLTISILLSEQAARARRAGDPAAVAEEAFEMGGFDFQGRPSIPFLEGPLLVCPGGKMEKSATSHDCTFVAIGSGWVWEYNDVLFDDMRQMPGTKWRRSITIVPATEGLEFDFVASQARSGGRCQLKTARSFVIRNGALVETKVRARASNGHR